MQKILVDTHVWLWYLDNNARLKQEHINAINEALQNNILYLSLISVWETITLLNKKRITTHLSHNKFIDEAVDIQGMHIQQITLDILKENGALPGEFHSDPADRLIVATARVEDLSLITYDAKILDYAKRGFISIV